MGIYDRYTKYTYTKIDIHQVNPMDRIALVFTIGILRISYISLCHIPDISKNKFSKSSYAWYKLSICSPESGCNQYMPCLFDLGMVYACHENTSKMTQDNFRHVGLS